MNRIRQGTAPPSALDAHTGDERDRPRSYALQRLDVDYASGVRHETDLLRGDPRPRRDDVTHRPRHPRIAAGLPEPEHCWVIVEEQADRRWLRLRDVCGEPHRQRYEARPVDAAEIRGIHDAVLIHVTTRREHKLSRAAVMLQPILRQVVVGNRIPTVIAAIDIDIEPGNMQLCLEPCEVGCIIVHSIPLIRPDDVQRTDCFDYEKLAAVRRLDVRIPVIVRFVVA